MTKLNRYLIRFALAALVLVTACSDDSTSPVNGEVVRDTYPLAIGNRWEYALDQSVYVDNDGTIFSASSHGRQIVTVARTENIGGDESFGLDFDHQIEYLFSEGADTVLERRYMAPLNDGRILLKAEETVYNPTGGFIPFGNGSSNEPRLGTMLNIEGKERFISLERLAYLLSDPRGHFWKDQSQAESSTLLASDGVQNNENAFLYEEDYNYVYKELYEGLSWISLPANGVGGVEISNRVTAILDELEGYSGPIAEVQQTNSLYAYSALGSENYTQLFYYKGGVGLIKVEISDPKFGIIAQYPDSSVFVGYGTWTFIKTLNAHLLK